MIDKKIIVIILVLFIALFATHCSAEQLSGRLSHITFDQISFNTCITAAHDDYTNNTIYVTNYGGIAVVKD